MITTKRVDRGSSHAAHALNLRIEQVGRPGQDQPLPAFILLPVICGTRTHVLKSAGSNPPSMTVVTRFAPSPTGFLHIGGARTALFNWLYARGRGGRMLLRIEDTDRERSTKEAIAAILDGLTWLGIAWDGDAVYQFSRAARHREVADLLLAAGQAYRCYASQQELDEMRELARREGRAKLYDGRWRDRDPSEAPLGVKPVIRLRAPLTGETVIEDQVQGRVVWQNENLDDLVLLRSDGTPTYMLAVVVDDHDMAVTHIIRGDDHLTNAARQKQIYDALGWSVPVMAHIPLIHGPDGSKLSKRHGALGVDAYRAMGYLPAAMRNYLVRLGWSHGDQEIFSTDEMIAAFDLPQIGRSPARFDFAKLESLNGHYLRQTADADLLTELERVLPHIALDGVDVFLLLLRRIGVVEAQMTAAAELLRDAEIEADRLGVANVQIAVGLRRKAGHHGVALCGEIRLDDIADEIPPHLRYRRSSCRHAAAIPLSMPWLMWQIRRHAPRPSACE